MKIKVCSVLLALFLLAGACKQPAKKENMNTYNPETNKMQAVPGNWNDLFETIEPTEIPDNPVELIAEDWMLVTAGKKDGFNTMTASWGAIGEIWNKPSAFIFIRDTRYTFEFLQKDSCFTLSFYPENYRRALQICGSKSGRDTDKIKEAGLTPMETPAGNMAFGEASMVIECKKMFVQHMDRKNFMPRYEEEINNRLYKTDPADHFMFVGEITHVWVRKTAE